MNKSITKALEAQQRANLHLKVVVREAQLACQHTEWVEADYQPLHHSSLPPMRMCCNCGLTEDGWGCGHLVLKDRKDGLLVTASRDYIYQRRQGLSITDSHKGPLLRREITLAELIERETK
jgi:hypothetical protein